MNSSRRIGLMVSLLIATLAFSAAGCATTQPGPGNATGAAAVGQPYPPDQPLAARTPDETTIREARERPIPAESPAAPGRPGGMPEFRWQTNEVPYEEAPLDDKIGRNIRDGLLGIIDNAFQGVFSGVVIVSQTGFITQKFVTFTGDVVGLVDDNAITEHVFKGILSKQLLKFGSRAQGMPRALGGIHETQFDAPRRTLDDYLGDRAFHVKAYSAPSGVVTLVGVIVGDLIVRPAGNFITIFGARETGRQLDEIGLDLVEGGLNVPFI